MTTFTADAVPDQTGRTIVVTGASSGLGRVTAQVLAARGARVLIAVRDLDKGRAAAASMRGEVVVRRLDLADLGSVREFAAEVTEPVDVLINNAGVMATPLGRTADGFELQLGTNHLGHFALTNLLLPRIRGRVVTVASTGHRSGTIDLDDLNWDRRPYRPMGAYAQSKLANLLFTAELQRRLTGAGSDVLATAAHPGMAATNLLGHLDEQPSLRRRLMLAATRRLAQSDADGALPTLYAAVADVPGGAYAGPRGPLQNGGGARLVGRSRTARDGDLAQRLWAASEALTGVTFPLAAVARG